MLLPDSHTRKSLSLIACGVAWLLAAGPLEAAGTWKAGVARVDITPAESIWMAGYAARTKPSEGVLHPIHAKALAIEDESGTVSVLVTADLGGFRDIVGDKIAALAAKRYRLPRERLVLNASHTHSGPITRVRRYPSYKLDREHIEAINRYQPKLIAQVVAVIGEAIKNLSPATLSYEQGLAGFAVNRRRVRHREYPGPTDHDVPVLAVRKPGGDLIAVAFGYACHATVLSNYKINGDWPGFAQSAVEKLHPGAVALFVNGCGADQNPLPRRTEVLARRYGDTLATAVSEVLGKKMKDLAGPLRAAYEKVDLPFNTPTKAELDKRLSDANRRKREHAGRMLKILEDEGKLMTHFPYPVQVWQFGDSLTFIALAGEVVVDYSLRFKGAYGWNDTWVSSYNNDVFGYVPSLRVLREGGYEGGDAMLFTSLPGPFRSAVEETIADKVDDLVRRTAGAGAP